MVIVMTGHVGCPSPEVHGRQVFQSVYSAAWVPGFSGPKLPSKGGEERACPKTLRRQEGVPGF